MRTNRSPSAGSTIVNTLRPYEGGTGQVTAPAARSAMNLVAASDINQPNGIAGLDVNSKIQASQMPDNGPAPFGVQGPVSVVVGSTTNYVITNYDIFTAYTLSAVGGSVDRNGNTITYNAPGAAGASGFVLNGRPINVSILDYQPLTPTLAAVDVFGGTNNAAASCTGSQFTMNGGSFTQASADWQIASDVGFSNIVSQSLNDTSNLMTWVSGSLALSTVYYARVRYRDVNGGTSDWSNVVTVTTKASYSTGTEEAILVASDGTTSNLFGSGIGVNNDGTRVAIGAPGNTNGSTTGSGAVYVFIRNGTTWTQEAKLLSTVPITTGNLGKSVSMTGDGTRILAGAPGETGATASGGAAYVFVRNTTNNTWSVEKRIAATDAGALAADDFGLASSISSDGSRVAIGANGATVAGSTLAGKAFIFTRSGANWTQEVMLTANDPATNVHFGWSVNFSGDTNRLAVGAYNAVIGGVSGVGAVYVYIRSGTTWTLEQKIVHTDGVNGRTFGYSVSMTADGSRIAIGCASLTVASIGSGGAYVYVRSGSVWTQEAKLVPSDGAANDLCGYAISMSSDGTRFTVGSFQAASGGFTNAGKAYTFNRSGTTWSQGSILLASTYTTNTRYGGSAIAITPDNTRIIVGGWGYSASTGRAWVYR